MFTLYKKELNYYLQNPIGYIVVILFALFANFLFVKDIFVSGSASLRPFFAFLPWLMLVFIPAISMRIFSEEKRTNTIEVLLTLPISETQLVVAKFVALFTMTIIGLFLTFALPVSLSVLAKLYLPEVVIAYLGVCLMAGMFISLSLLFSVYTKNQVVAFLISTIGIFILLVLGTDFMANVFPKIILDFLSYFTPVYHFQNFVKGIVDLRSVVYFVSGTVLFLLLTIISLEKRD
jgi:ABC-2 type transport system permease protein